MKNEDELKNFDRVLFFSSGNDTGNDAEGLPEIVSGRKKIFFLFSPSARSGRKKSFLSI
jgi:hypothetical protein